MIERYLTLIDAFLQTLPIFADYQAILDLQRTAFVRTNGEIIASNQKRDEHLDFYHRIQQKRQEGWNISQLAHEFHCRPATIRKYFYATTFPERKPHRLGHSMIDPYLPYLQQRVQAGCENGQQLWREIQQQGYPGSNRQVMKWLHHQRTQVSQHTPFSKRLTKPLSSRKSGLSSSKQLAWLLVRDTATLSKTDQILLAHLQQSESLSSAYHHVQRFVSMIKNRALEYFDDWLADSDNQPVYQIQTFAMGLRQDYAAVRAALETQWSNGQTEGQVNRLKFIKRRCMDALNLTYLGFAFLPPLNFT